MMKKCRNQKRICLLLAIAILISGICLETIPAGSSFSCNKTQTIAKVNGICRELSVCRTETLSKREIVNSLKTSKKELRRNQVRVFYPLGFGLSNAEILPQIFQSNMSAEGGVNSVTFCSEAILSYIHEQDGEKA